MRKSTVVSPLCVGITHPFPDGWVISEIYHANKSKGDKPLVAYFMVGKQGLQLPVVIMNSNTKLTTFILNLLKKLFKQMTNSKVGVCLQNYIEWCFMWLFSFWSWKMGNSQGKCKTKDCPFIGDRRGIEFNHNSLSLRFGFTWTWRTWIFTLMFPLYFT